MKAYTRELRANKIFQSMSRKGNCLDNSIMENFFGLLKQEIYYGKVKKLCCSLLLAMVKDLLSYRQIALILLAQALALIDEGLVLAGAAGFSAIEKIIAFSDCNNAIFYRKLFCFDLAVQ